MGFMVFPINSKAKKDKVPFYDYILAALGIIVFGYLILNYDANIAKGGKAALEDLILGSLAILLVLEITRRSVGAALPIVAIIFLLYASKLGPLFQEF